MLVEIYGKGENRMQKGYFVNPNTGTLHIIGGCYHSETVPKGLKIYKSEDEAIAENQRYMKHCKLCFKNKDIM